MNVLPILGKNDSLKSVAFVNLQSLSHEIYEHVNNISETYSFELNETPYGWSG